MAKYINPFTDYGFKRIFGQEANKELLLDFLNNLLMGERRIVDLTFKDKERLGLKRGDRALIYDIYCVTDTGEHIIVEMQNHSHANFLSRMLYYSSKAIAEQGERGQTWQYDIKAVYSVAFMNFTTEELSGFRTDVVLANRATGDTVSDKIRMTFLQLPCFAKSGPEECDNDFERWIFTLKHMDEMENLPYAAQNAAFQRLANVAAIAGMTSTERRRYEAALKVYRDNLAVKAQEEIEKEKREARDRASREEAWAGGRAEGKAEGRAEGRAEGMAEGMAKGMAEGMAKGKAEGMARANMETALRMMALQMPIEKVAEILQVTEEQIAAWMTVQKGEA